MDAFFIFALYSPNDTPDTLQRGDAVVDRTLSVSIHFPCLGPSLGQGMYAYELLRSDLLPCQNWSYEW